jgi:hypothetical protein
LPQWYIFPKEYMGKRNAIAWRTDLTVEESLRRLREATDIGEQTPFSFSGYKGSKPVLSEFDGNSFKLWKRRYYRNAFAPFFRGALIREERGAHIEGRFGKNTLAFILTPIVAGIVLLFVVPQLISAYPGHAPSVTWSDALIILLIGICGPKAGELIGKNEERSLRDFLETTLAATPDESGFSLSARTIESKPL